MDRTEARLLRAKGVPITTLDGRELRLIFDVEAIAEIEDAFGSLGDMQDALEALSNEQQRAKLFKPLLVMLRAGLVHDESARDAKFDTALVNEYFDAVMKATDLAFPKDSRPIETTNGKTTNDDTNPYPGTTSIISRPSDTGAAMAHSGE